ncbi:hypothetical protein C9374_010581 [Naegleria lovaniensis]|uniref:F-box domain-containing protein n=1 Tax=Naegleria lovaniensis TaxID=51637 RepID=A0AA88GFC0_NAELO|nr:uncharacterized protein C9374_010581 [Naegleria lovaniensis]KAG2374562.1 hypothetical protein C9374_010581 [Naegleria lovaniensis]
MSNNGHRTMNTSLQNLYDDFFRDIDSNSPLRRMIPSPVRTSTRNYSMLPSSRYSDYHSSAQKSSKFQIMYAQLPLEMHYHLMSFLDEASLMKMAMSGKCILALVTLFMIGGGGSEMSKFKSIYSYARTNPNEMEFYKISNSSCQQLKTRISKRLLLIMLQNLNDLVKKENKKSNTASISSTSNASSSTIRNTYSSSNLTKQSPRGSPARLESVTSSSTSNLEKKSSLTRVHSDFNVYLSKFDLSNDVMDNNDGMNFQWMEEFKIQHFIYDFNALDLQDLTSVILLDSSVMNTLRKTLISIGAFKNIQALYLTVNDTISLDLLFPYAVKSSSGFFSKLMGGSSSEMSPAIGVASSSVDSPPTSSSTLLTTTTIQDPTPSLLSFEDLLPRIKVLQLTNYIPKKKYELNQLLKQTVSLMSLEIEFPLRFFAKIDPLKSNEHLSKNLTNLSIVKPPQLFMSELDPFQEFPKLKTFNYIILPVMDNAATKMVLMNILEGNVASASGSTSKLTAKLLDSISSYHTVIENFVNRLKNSKLETINFVQRPPNHSSPSEITEKLFTYLRKTGEQSPIILFPMLKELTTNDSPFEDFKRYCDSWSLLLSGGPLTHRFHIGTENTLEVLTYIVLMEHLPYGLMKLVKHHSKSLQKIILEAHTRCVLDHALLSVDSGFSNLQYLSVSSFTVTDIVSLLNPLLRSPKLRHVQLKGMTFPALQELDKKAIKSQSCNSSSLETLEISDSSMYIQFLICLIYPMRKSLTHLKISNCTMCGNSLTRSDIYGLIGLTEEESSNDVTPSISEFTHVDCNTLIRFSKIHTLQIEKSSLGFCHELFSVFSFPCIHSVIIGPDMKCEKEYNTFHSIAALSTFIKGSSAIYNNNHHEKSSDINGSSTTSTTGELSTSPTSPTLLRSNTAMIDTFFIPSLENFAILHNRSKDSMNASFFNTDLLQEIFKYHAHSLTCLKLNAPVNISANIWKEVFTPSKRLCHNLKTLHIYSYKFSNEEIQDLLEFLRHFNNLTDLYIELDGKNPSNEFFERLEEKCINLEHVEILGNGSNDVSYQSLLNFVIQLKNLQSLTLHFEPRVTNTFTGVSSIEDLKTVYQSRIHKASPKIIFQKPVSTLAKYQQ